MVLAIADMAFNCSLGLPLPIVKDKKLIWWNLQTNKLIRFGPSHQMTSKAARKLNSLARVYRTVQCSAVASNMGNYEATLKQARVHFAQEIMCTKQDSEISLIKALLLISAEDEAFMSLNRAKDKLALQVEGRYSLEPANACGNKGDDGFHIAGRTMVTWLSRFDFLAGEVEKVLVRKGSNAKLAEILKAVNSVFFEIQGLLLCIIYMEICKRVGITAKVAEIGGEVLIWPLVDNIQPEEQRSCFLELLEAQKKSHLVDISSKGLDGDFSSLMHFPSNKDIVGKVLTKLKMAYWIAACKAHPGRSLTDALHPLVSANERITETFAGGLLRPQELRLSLLASERLLLLQPHNWLVRRDHGLLLYHSGRYGEALTELSICVAFAPTSEAQMLEHFVGKLHLMRAFLGNSVMPPPTAPSALA